MVVLDVFEVACSLECERRDGVACELFDFSACLVLQCISQRKRSSNSSVVLQHPRAVEWQSGVRGAASMVRFCLVNNGD
jgi:hypothetical protein